MFDNIKLLLKLRPVAERFREIAKMKFSSNMIFQILMLVIQGYNQIEGTLSPENKQVAALFIGVLQAIVALWAHYRNPDGTPVTTAYVAKKKSQLPMILIPLLLIPMLAVPQLRAQDKPNKWGAAGMGINADGNIMGWGAIALPLTEKAISWTTYDISMTEKVDPEGPAFDLERLKYKTRTGFGYQMYLLQLGKFQMTVWGLADAGVSGTEDSAVGSFAYGGFVDVPFVIKGIHMGAIGVLQAERDAQNGDQFNKRFGFRVKF